MNISHIEHIAIAVKSLETAIPYYENVLGLKCYNIEEVADQKVKTAFFKVGQTKIELLEPTCPESTIAKFIENKGEGLHHVAFAVPDTAAALNELAEKEIRLKYKRRKQLYNLRALKKRGKELMQAGITYDNIDETAELIAQYGIVPKAPLAKKALPGCHIVNITGSELKNTLEGFLNVIYEMNPKAVGGALPSADFYYGI